MMPDEWQTRLYPAASAARPHVTVFVPRSAVPHPATFARRSCGLPRGQLADFRYPTGTGCWHIEEFSDGYKAHLDLYDPARDWFRHFIFDVLYTLPDVG